MSERRRDADTYAATNLARRDQASREPPKVSLEVQNEQLRADLAAAQTESAARRMEIISLQQALRDYRDLHPGAP